MLRSLLELVFWLAVLAALVPLVILVALLVLAFLVSPPGIVIAMYLLGRITR